ncbi:4-hydroxy-tetrahydrodipicolinate reductase [Leucobacter insecticola]|uniref:4-hydroxy-tetrahydrodipicolinate reductase n=1 Tax=Leucobacter insecticola TaxID=2714934 RepID=A0A6G8FKS3_9MICO|nr:4-hydroxy-tetrahydrodipicolinate reductase [Leucobacter insecticola]QIM16938.1 4-hydroxy-tetrahydrodipicolinate reductase [Leucobacter insecticola]
MTTRVAVAGATGRLGSLVCEIVEADPAFELVARLGRASDTEAGADAHLLVDVSHPDASPAIVERALARGQRVLVGTSGWSEDRLTALAATVAATPGAAVLVVPNFSLGSVLGTALAQIAAKFYDSIEVIEAHHPGKVDSPSGTAVRTAELMAKARNGRPVDAPHADQSPRGELVAGIPVHSLRLAGVVAKQEVRLGGDGEVLTITHDTHSNAAYRAGISAALHALLTAQGLTVGLDGVLGLSGLAGSGAGVSA